MLKFVHFCSYFTSYFPLNLEFQGYREKHETQVSLIISASDDVLNVPTEFEDISKNNLSWSNPQASPN